MAAAAAECGDDPVSLPMRHYQEAYKVLRQIANGAFGSVHCVQRRDTKVIRAAKYVKSRSKDLEREVNALRTLRKSPLVLQFISYYTHPSGVGAVLVTEFLAGGDLCERTSAKDYALTEHKCRTIVRQICRGVQYIHQNNFLHLDLKPFNIVFCQRKDDFNLRIIDFGLAREIDETRRTRVGMCGTVEYMSPEVMNCTVATPASDCWGVGVIAYQLLSGGVSPFFAMNRFRTMAKVLDCDYSLERPELARTSPEAKDFISRLLVKEPGARMDAGQCLQHRWLVDDKLYLGILETLETSWMRRCLARRRWYRLLNAVRVMTSIRLVTGSAWTSERSNSHQHQLQGSSSSEEDSDGSLLSSSYGSTLAIPRPQNGLRGGLAIHDISTYHNTFEKLHLIMNNGAFGTQFCVQHAVSGEVFCAKHVKHSLENTRREASILHHVRNEPSVVSFHGLYEAPHHSVVITDFLVGGDLVERTASQDFVLNESKCKAYVRQICAGIVHIHACKVVHLDLKPFSIVFTTRDDDAQLKITDFDTAQWLDQDRRIKITEMVGSLEFMAPEMLECTFAMSATDCWGIGVISYMLITGGQSPFYGGNRFRTMAKILSRQVNLAGPELQTVSAQARRFIGELLELDPAQRMSASACLEHPWLAGEDDRDSPDQLKTLETSWMKQLLARRRWQRWFNAVRATQRMRKLSSSTTNFTYKM